MDSPASTPPASAGACRPHVQPGGAGCSLPCPPWTAALRNAFMVRRQASLVGRCNVPPGAACCSGCVDRCAARWVARHFEHASKQTVAAHLIPVTLLRDAVLLRCAKPGREMRRAAGLVLLGKGRGGCPGCAVPRALHLPSGRAVRPAAGAGPRHSRAWQPTLRRRGHRVRPRYCLRRRDRGVRERGGRPPHGGRGQGGPGEGRGGTWQGLAALKNEFSHCPRF